MNRRTFLKTLVAGTAGLLLPQQVLAEPARRIWALDQTMVGPVDDFRALLDPEGQLEYDMRLARMWKEHLNRLIRGDPDPDWFDAEYSLTHMSNKITVGDYQADCIIMPRKARDAWVKLLNDVQG